jgi:hypothetical protein
MGSIEHLVEQIREKGYVKIPKYLSEKEIDALRTLAVTQYEAVKEIDSREDTPYLNQGHKTLYNLQNKDIRFLKPVLSSELIRRVLVVLLNDPWYRQIPATEPNYILRSVIARSGGPQAMPLHIDSFIPSSGSHVWSAQAAIILEPQKIVNGCTIVVPGSHRIDRYASPTDLVNSVPIESEPGDVVIWDSRLWHGTTANTTSGTRWSIVATFTRWWIKQNYEIARNLPQKIYDLLTPSEKSMMGYCSLPPRDENDRLDIKCGPDFLKPQVADYFR